MPLSAKGYAWFWPKITAAITAKHPWLVVVCDSYETVIDLDLLVRPRDPEASIRVALRNVRCPRCNGHGRPRIMALARLPSILRSAVVRKSRLADTNCPNPLSPKCDVFPFGNADRPLAPKRCERARAHLYATGLVHSWIRRIAVCGAP